MSFREAKPRERLQKHFQTWWLATNIADGVWVSPAEQFAAGWLQLGQRLCSTFQIPERGGRPASVRRAVGRPVAWFSEDVALCCCLGKERGQPRCCTCGRHSACHPARGTARGAAGRAWGSPVGQHSPTLSSEQGWKLAPLPCEDQSRVVSSHTGRVGGCPPSVDRAPELMRRAGVPLLVQRPCWGKGKCFVQESQPKPSVAYEVSEHRGY